MEYEYIFSKLENNKKVFSELLGNVSKEERLWKQSSEKWCLIEIICHLHDEEIEDFRTRVKYTLETPAIAPPPIDPQGWVKKRNYISLDYDLMLQKFLEERDRSVEWLRSLSHPEWNNSFEHPELGPRKASMYLANWLAHDYLHFRQITKLKYDYLQSIADENLDYAGNW